MMTTQRYFCYCDMQTSERQLEILGRKITGKKDILSGFKMIGVEGFEEPFATRSAKPHDQVGGTLYNISFVDLFHLDEYEKQFNTTRIKAKLKSGLMAWVYIYGLN
ncbi:gamma-glutamylcyclotransferase family protein [Allomuricauda sp. SCSIO 65647]|uniref:gamma-glutamylcyclotransferase family protein n=1 Tax=Allomuricauda sp. SCSIO 65647 TaxID=2908843 RepID=UPI001F2BCBCA|nr:gamma-glutamylcyclotransferase family protein [Muricauda sp. SCSIO 65647]UJH68682.1 gamma-glutamylcyclotransferase [Muricauda sp. SCSIO 65647]